LVLSQDLAGRKSTIAAVPVGFFEMERRGTNARTGENAFIAFGLAALGITWTQRLGAVFWGGLLFAIITLLRVRPWLVVVGLLMLASARHIAYDDMTELVPAFATIALLVFTYNIANGLTAGLALHPIVKVAAGRAREVRPGAWVLAAMSFLYYAFGIPH
jgi:AGZA family xanthine/uracil permease-like MFS transporter